MNLGYYGIQLHNDILITVLLLYSRQCRLPLNSWLVETMAPRMSRNDQLKELSAYLDGEVVEWYCVIVILLMTLGYCGTAYCPHKSQYTRLYPPH